MPGLRGRGGRARAPGALRPRRPGVRLRGAGRLGQEDLALPDTGCPVGTFSETHALIGARAELTTRAISWATDALARAAAEAGYRTCFTTAAGLAVRCLRAAIEGRWATTVRLFAGPTLPVIDELGYLALPAEPPPPSSRSSPSGTSRPASS